MITIKPPKIAKLFKLPIKVSELFDKLSKFKKFTPKKIRATCKKIKETEAKERTVSNCVINRLFFAKTKLKVITTADIIKKPAVCTSKPLPNKESVLSSDKTDKTSVHKEKHQKRQSDTEYLILNFPLLNEAKTNKNRARKEPIVTKKVLLKSKEMAVFGIKKIGKKPKVKIRM